MIRRIALASAIALLVAQPPVGGDLKPLEAALRAEFHRAVGARHANGNQVLLLVIDADTVEDPSLPERLARFANAHYTGDTIQAINVEYRRVRRTGTPVQALVQTQVTFVGGFLTRLLDGRVTPTVLDPRTFTARTLAPFEIGGALSVTQATVDGHPVWRFVETTGLSVDSLIADRATLRPIEEWRTDRGQRDRQIVYDGPRVTGFPFDTTFAVAPFAAPELEAILRALPLQPGYAARFPLYWLHSLGGDFRWEEIYVVGVDSVCQCWSINTTGMRPGLRQFEIPLKP